MPPGGLRVLLLLDVIEEETDLSKDMLSPLLMSKGVLIPRRIAW